MRVFACFVGAILGESILAPAKIPYYLRPIPTTRKAQTVLLPSIDRGGRVG